MFAKLSSASRARKAFELAELREDRGRWGAAGVGYARYLLRFPLRAKGWNRLGRVAYAGLMRADGKNQLAGVAGGNPATPKGGRGCTDPAGGATIGRFEMVKQLPDSCRDEIAIFACHSHTGAIKPHVIAHLKLIKSQGVDIVLVVSVDRPAVIGNDIIDLASSIIVRENVGFDFSAWALVLSIFPQIYHCSVLYLINDSIMASEDGAKFKAVFDRIRRSPAALVGLTESLEYRWHIQSYFLALKTSLICSDAFQRYMSEIRDLTSKDEVIQAYELTFAENMQNAGFQSDVLFPARTGRNPTLYAWRALLSAGYPYVKALLLRGEFPDVERDGWQAAIVEAGFDLSLVEDSLKAAQEGFPQQEDNRLLAYPIRRCLPLEHKLRVSFYGPWNYDNGLGAAARNIVESLRRCDVLLNVHPIRKPFHVHHPLTPPVDLLDFTGPCDIAIVHLNPDSWFLLTDEQREAVQKAGKRIGYWVWEMGHLPPSWRENFFSVDRIWAPSRYCADLFARHATVPVDVVPHPIALPASLEVDRNAELTRLGLPLESRIILYVFDASSYIVRKNPMALVRAFDAAGLAERGWRLVLKTKSLMERPAEGANLIKLVAQTAGATIVDRRMPPRELASLLALADVYASPHCSEGFGLTIAEAMAAGKIVVATDFGGSTDMLNSEVGYPVAAHPWVLEDDFGHYTKGGRWARIDDEALIDALKLAAADVDRGDFNLGNAARAKMTNHFSLDAVAETAGASLRAVMVGHAPEGEAERFVIDPSGGMDLPRIDLGPSVDVFALASNGAALSELPEDKEQAGDNWLMLAPLGTLVAPFTAECLMRYAGQRPDVGIFYADDVACDCEEAVDQIRLKPEFDPVLLAAQDYVGAPLFIRRSVLADLGGLQLNCGTAATMDLLFRAHYAGLSIARIPEVLLVHPAERIRAHGSDHKNVVSRQPQFTDYDVYPGRTADTLALRRRFPSQGFPWVTLVVPTCRAEHQLGGETYVERLLKEIATTDWPMDRLSVIVGDDIAEAPAWHAVAWPFTLRRIVTPRSPETLFNYAAKMNALWRLAESEQIVFMNDDVRPLGRDWLQALQTFALNEEVGGVGGRLLFEDGSLQHVGLMPHGAGAAHKWIGRRRYRGTYQDWALVHREWSMVTGAIFATRRTALERVGGFDELFSLEFNDVDLCLRMRATGLHILSTPHAEFVHAEKASRGERPPPGNERARFTLRWRAWLDQDPCWHPMLQRNRIEVLPQIDGKAWFFRK